MVRVTCLVCSDMACTLLQAATATVHHWPHSLSSPPAQSAERVEARLKGLALLKGIRISEFFKDFDPLRSGKITSKSTTGTRLLFICWLNLQRLSFDAVSTSTWGYQLVTVTICR